MPKAKRRLNAIAIGLSVAAHAVVLGVLAFHAPRLMAPQEQAGPPEPVIPVLIMPRTPPPPPGVEKPPPIRLHRRQLRRGPLPPPPVEPFVTPPSLPTPRAPPRPSGPPRYTVQPSPGAQLSTTLRNSLVGCANPTLLSRGERERCQERLGREASEVPPLAPAGDPALAGAAAAREAARQAREAGVPPGTSGAFGDSGASYRAPTAEPPPPPRLRP